MSAGADFDNIIERERGLRRELSARRLTMIAIGGAIGTGLFLGSGFAISLAGPGVLVSYAFGALIALLLMGCLAEIDRKSTRLNSSHVAISYAVFCLKKKTNDRSYKTTLESAAAYV